MLEQQLSFPAPALLTPDPFCDAAFGKKEPTLLWDQHHHYHRRKKKNLMSLSCSLSRCRRSIFANPNFDNAGFENPSINICRRRRPQPSLSVSVDRSRIRDWILGSCNPVKTLGRREKLLSSLESPENKGTRLLLLGGGGGGGGSCSAGAWVDDQGKQERILEESCHGGREKTLQP